MLRLRMTLSQWLSNLSRWPKRSDNGKKTMVLKYFIASVFLVVYIVYGRELGFTTCSPIWTHFTYSFQHGSILHLIINTSVFITVFRVMERFIRPFTLFFVIYIISVMVSFSAMDILPTVGSSGMIYAMFGMETVIVIFNSATAKQKRLFFFSIALMLCMSLVNGGSSFMVHIASFTFGALFFMAKRERDLYRSPSHN